MFVCPPIFVSERTLIHTRADASTDALISRNSFDDLSGGALKIGNVNDTRAVSNQTSDFDARYTVEDNFLSNIGLEYRGAAAVFAGCVIRECARLRWSWRITEHALNVKVFAA